MTPGQRSQWNRPGHPLSNQLEDGGGACIVPAPVIEDAGWKATAPAKPFWHWRPTPRNLLLARDPIFHWPFSPSSACPRAHLYAAATDGAILPLFFCLTTSQTILLSHGDPSPQCQLQVFDRLMVPSSDAPFLGHPLYPLSGHRFVSSANSHATAFMSLTKMTPLPTEGHAPSSTTSHLIPEEATLLQQQQRNKLRKSGSLEARVPEPSIPFVISRLRVHCLFISP